MYLPNSGFDRADSRDAKLGFETVARRPSSRTTPAPILNGALPHTAANMLRDASGDRRIGRT